jgi:hypothetical protein
MFGTTAFADYYTPTAANVQDASSITAHKAQYSQDDGVMHVSGSVSFSGASAFTKVSLSLPVSSALASVYDCNGVVGESPSYNVGVVYADPSSDKAVIEINPLPQDTVLDYYYSFMCEIL